MIKSGKKTEGSKILQPLVQCYIDEGWSDVARYLLRILLEIWKELGDSVSEVRCLLQGVTLFGPEWSEQTLERLKSTSVEGLSLVMGPVVSSSVEINKSEQKVGENLKIKVTLLSKFKVTIYDCQVEFGVRPYEEFEKATLEVPPIPLPLKHEKITTTISSLEPGPNTVTFDYPCHSTGRYALDTLTLLAGVVSFSSDYGMKMCEFGKVDNLISFRVQEGYGTAGIEIGKVGGVVRGKGEQKYEERSDGRRKTVNEVSKLCCQFRVRLY